MACARHTDLGHFLETVEDDVDVNDDVNDMGAYLSQPVKEKESSDGGNARVKFGTSAMQGWRTSMEVSETLSELLSSRRLCVFCVLCVMVLVLAKGFCVVSTFCHFGRGFFFFKANEKAAKTKDGKESSSSSASSFVVTFFFLSFVVPRMDGCLSSSFVVVLSQNTVCLLTCFGFLCIVSSSL